MEASSITKPSNLQTKQTRSGFLLLTIGLQVHALSHCLQVIGQVGCAVFVRLTRVVQRMCDGCYEHETLAQLLDPGDNCDSSYSEAVCWPSSCSKQLDQYLKSDADERGLPA